MTVEDFDAWWEREGKHGNPFNLRRAYAAGIAAVHHEAPEPNLPKAEGESILREALARLADAAEDMCQANNATEAKLAVRKLNTELIAARSVLAGTPPA